MNRQSNTYRNLPPNVVRLTIGSKVPTVVTFDMAFIADVKLYKWSYRGKGIIVNEFGVTLCNFLAECYGYSEGYTRKVANGDYTADNYAYREAAAAEAYKANAAKIAATREANKNKVFDDMGVPFFPREKYKNKYECITLNIARVGPKGLQVGTVSIQVNKFIQQYIPTKVVIVDGVPTCLDGTQLKVLILEKLDADVNVRAHKVLSRLQDEFDLRVDPGDMSFVSRRMNRQRHHHIVDDDDGEEYTVIEIQECMSMPLNFFWRPADAETKWRIPATATVNEPRTYYIVVDSDIAERCDEVWWEDRSSDWRVRDADSTKLDNKGFIAHTSLKRMVMASTGTQIDNIYMAPRYNIKYQKALDCMADLSTAEGRRAARIRARYENHMAAEGGQAMFTAPKRVLRRQVIADKQYFCSSMYGGVGVWCFDMRRQSVRLRGITAPEQDKAAN
jgi:hypothetical protein